MDSLGFSSFRELLDIWDHNQEKIKVKVLLEDNGLVFFFKKDNTIYGATENNRLTFSRMKNPEKEDENWSKEASFTAVNLEDKELSKNIFNKKDIEQIEIIDQEKAEKQLTKKGKKLPQISDSDNQVDEK
jgi:hypothetical protein